MNGFEPLRRRIIDYTDAGQWSEVYDGPIEGCETEQLKVENDKLRKLVRDMHKWLWNGADCTECPFAAKCDLNAAFESDLHAHVCLGWSEIHRRMRELGVEV